MFMSRNARGVKQENRKAVEKVSWELLETYEVLSTIHRSAEFLAATEDMHRAARITLECAVEITGSAGGMILIPLEETLEVVAALNAGKDVGALARGGERSLDEGPFYEDDSPEGSLSGDGRTVHARLYVPFPMGARGMGHVFLFHVTDKVYSSIDVKPVQILCGQGALAMQCFLHLDTLKEKNLALRDAFEKLQAAQKELIRKERLSTLGRVAAMIVHDLKNPMSGLMGYAQLLETMAGELQPDEIREYAGVIIREMRRLSRMTEEIVEFSRGMETRLNLRLLTPRDLVAAAVPVIESEFHAAGAEFSWDRVDTSSALQADSDKMERVFINLAVNALHAMNGAGRLEIFSSCSEGMVEFAVRDSGPGIPREIQDTLFEPFVSKKEGKTSLGIGLSVARWVVEAHGGKIWVASTGPEGTEFRIRLPRDGKKTGGDAEAVSSFERAEAPPAEKEKG